MTEITNDDGAGKVERLRALMEKATDRPWLRSDFEGSTAIGTGPTESSIAVCVQMGSRSWREAEANAVLIVEAVNSLPDIIATIDRLTAERDALRECCHSFLERLISEQQNRDSETDAQMTTKISRLLAGGGA